MNKLKMEPEIPSTNSKRKMNGSFRLGSEAFIYSPPNIATNFLREKQMIRIALAAVISAAAAGSALALIPAEQVTSINDTRNETIISKTETWSLVSPLTVEECVDEACTMTVSN
jgi:hypothetical protein